MLFLPVSDVKQCFCPLLQGFCVINPSGSTAEYKPASVYLSTVLFVHVLLNNIEVLTLQILTQKSLTKCDVTVKSEVPFAMASDDDVMAAFTI